MKQLFEPLQIRNITVANRICVPAMVRHVFGMQETALVTKEHIAHYTQLAHGGAGLIIVEATAVSPHARATFTQVGLWADAQIEGHRALAQSVKAAGAAVVVQIQHAGSSGGTAPYVSASDAMRDGKTVRALTLQEMQALEQDFIAAILRAAKAGYDGVELHGAHGFFLSELLNTKTNRRTDVYGTNPLCFIEHVVSAVRAVVSPDFIIGIRLGGFEPTLEDALAHAKALEAMGLDYLNISFGVRQVHTINLPINYPFQAPFYAAKIIKQAVHIPVFAVNGIQNKLQAQRVVAECDIDMVCIGKGHLVNTQWANDAKENRDVGRCLGCANCAWRTPGICPGKALLEKSRAAAK